MLLQLSTKQQNLRLVQIGSICRQQNKCKRKIENCLKKGRKHSGKRRKCWLPAFSPFPTMFSKCFFPKVVKSRDMCQMPKFIFLRHLKTLKESMEGNRCLACISLCFLDSIDQDHTAQNSQSDL